MANEVHSPPERSVTSLVSGIIDDVQELIRQQATLIRSEIQDDFRKTKAAVSSMAVGVGVAVLGVILLSLMAVYRLQRARPELPLWACFAIVGGFLGLLGGALIYAGKKKFDSFNPLPDQSFQALKENLQWQTNPR